MPSIKLQGQLAVDAYDDKKATNNSTAAIQAREGFVYKEPFFIDRASVKNRLCNLWCILLVLSLMACQNSLFGERHLPVPGYYSYSIDWGIANDENNKRKKIKYSKSSITIPEYEYGWWKGGWGGLGVSGFTQFYPLKIDFDMVDGRHIVQTIDVESLIRKMLATHKVPNFKGKKFPKLRGSALSPSITLIAELDVNEIRFTYKILELHLAKAKKTGRMFAKWEYHTYDLGAVPLNIQSPTQESSDER